MFTDSHCHLNRLEHPTKALSNARDAGVTNILSACVTLEEFPEIVEIATREPEVVISIGVHPGEKIPFEPTLGVHPGEKIPFEPTLEQLLELGADPLVVGVGETGLDFYYPDTEQELQRERFYTHIVAAKQLQKPLIIHMREAAEELLTALKQEAVEEIGGVMHCFTESWEVAKRAMDLNFYISFSGIISFKNADNLREVVKNVPLSRMLIETDAPWLAPVPMRGKPNEPAYVQYVAEVVAAIKNLSVAEVATTTTENFLNCFINRRS